MRSGDFREIAIYYCITLDATNQIFLAYSIPGKIELKMSGKEMLVAHMPDSQERILYRRHCREIFTRKGMQHYQVEC